MEDIKTILDSIRQHTTAEANAYASNRTIGRGRVKSSDGKILTYMGMTSICKTIMAVAIVPTNVDQRRKGAAVLKRKRMTNSMRNT